MDDGPDSPVVLSRLLPQPVDPVPGNSFHDRFLLLLAGCARADGVLTYRFYRLAQEACRQVLGEQALHALLQAKLHQALLHAPNLDGTLNLARLMAVQAVEEQLPLSAVNGVLHAVRHVLSPDVPLTPKGKRLLDGIDAAFRTEAAPTWIQKPGFGVEQRLSELCRRAAVQMGLLDDVTERTLPADDTGFSRAELAELAELAGPVRALQDMAVVVAASEFSNDLQAFRKLTRQQPFRIVLAGEGRRGKSSVLNAVLGIELVPAGEAASTAAILRVRRSFCPEYQVHFHDAVHLERLEQAARNDPGNMLLTRALEQIRKGLDDGRFAAGSVCALDNAAELPDFLLAGSAFAGLVSRVEAGLDQPVLGDNVVLADTPPLNHINPFVAELAVEECLEADCVVFVLDARNPGSRSELDVVRRLVKSGRSVTVIGVLTGADHLHEVESAVQARETARAMLQEACRASAHVRLGGVLLVNARQAMSERCAVQNTNSASSANANLAPSEKCGEFATLFTLLREAIDLDAEKLHYRGKIQENFVALSSTAHKGLRRHMEDSLSRMPGPELLAMLEAHAAQLNEVTRLSLEQARQVVRTTLDDLDAWERNTERGLDRFCETLVLKLMGAVNAKVSEQGRNFAKASVWANFDSVEAQAIARAEVELFLEEQRETLEGWEAKLKVFSQRMDEVTRICLATANTLNQFDTENVMAAETERATHFLVQTHHYMKGLAVFATGAAIGRATFFSPLAVIISAGNMLALAIASPMIAAVVAAVAGTAGLVYHLGREDKRRTAFLERRHKEAQAYAQRITAALRDELRTARRAVTTLYEEQVQSGFSPALDSLFSQSAHLRLFLDTMHTIRADVNRYEAETERNLNALGTALTRKGLR